MSRIIQLYSTIVTCPNTAAECPNTINDPQTGNLPRGFYTQAENPEDVLALLVAKNPGHPLKQERDGLYRAMPATDQVRRHFELQQSIIYPSAELLAADRRSLTFSINLRRYMGYFLDMPEDQIFQKCAYTNLVKCTSIGETDRLQSQAIHECLNRHFSREVAIYSNIKVVIAFGREVEAALGKDHVNAKLRKPIVYVKHPSYYYAKKKVARILEELKSEISRYLTVGTHQQYDM